MTPITHIPCNARLTRYQQQVSNCIKETVPAIPDVVSELISTYVPDYSLAGQALIFSQEGEILNPDVASTIKLALIADDCEVSIKQLIFDNMRKYQAEQSKTPSGSSLTKTDFYKDAFSSMSLEINKQGDRLNLDNVYMEGISLRMHLDNMTAKRAVFKNVMFDGVSLKNVNLTGATLDNSTFFYCSLRSVVAVDLVCKNMHFVNTEVNNMLTNDPVFLDSGKWTTAGFKPLYLALDCTISTKPDQKKIKASRLPDHPPSA